MKKPGRSVVIGDSLLTAPRKANPVAVAPFVRNEELFGIFDKIVSVIRRWWPKKTAAHVSHITGVSERAVQFWLARETGLSLENVVALLRSEAGYEVLEAVMGDCQEEWWLTTKIAHGLKQTRRAIAAQQKRLDELRAQRDQVDLFEK